MALDISGIVVALCSLAGLVVTSLVAFAKIRDERHRRRQAEQEMRFQRAALGFPEFVEEWGEIVKDIISLMRETSVDRFLILRAWNGHLEPRWTTAIYQMREADQEPYTYVHFELDVDYVGRLREISLRNTMYFEVDDMPDGFLKDVYKAEGVTASMLCHLATHQPAGTDSVAHTYCSFATHSKGALDEKEITRCRVLASRMKGLAEAFDNKG